MISVLHKLWIVLGLLAIGWAIELVKVTWLWKAGLF